ncbi:hypothetical protein [Solimonas marina]|uniref:Terminase small subunit n=1 Tax=Solimonas marina TaxID=2714601 RepID=A0A969WA86_9GAMM|nr:hypothetical protein [Solimonas marina]NKF23232.1 hypothetical protein [Solimonas marina]
MAKGIKTGGGSRKGRPNRATAKREAEITASGLTPLDFLLTVMRDGSRETAERMDAAKAAAPYCHPRLAAQTLSIGGEASYEDRLRLLCELDAMSDEQLVSREAALRAELEEAERGRHG